MSVSAITLERLGVGLQKRRAVAGRGVGHECVDAAELVRELVDHRVGARDARKVGLAVRNPYAVRFELGHDLGEVGLVLVPGEPDVEPVGGERSRAGAPDAGVASRDDRDRHDGRATQRGLALNPGGHRAHGGCVHRSGVG